MTPPSIHVQCRSPAQRKKEGIRPLFYVATWQKGDKNFLGCTDSSADGTIIGCPCSSQEPPQGVAWGSSFSRMGRDHPCRQGARGCIFAQVGENLHPQVCPLDCTTSHQFRYPGFGRQSHPGRHCSVAHCSVVVAPGTVPGTGSLDIV